MPVISEEELYLILESSPCGIRNNNSPCISIDMGNDDYAQVAMCDDTLAYAQSIGYTIGEFAVAVLRFAKARSF